MSLKEEIPQNPAQSSMSPQCAVCGIDAVLMGQASDIVRGTTWFTCPPGVR